MSSGNNDISLASSEMLLQSLWNAIKTTNDVINECNNNNQQNATGNDPSSTGSRSSYAAACDANGSLKNRDDVECSPPTAFKDAAHGRWAQESRRPPVDKTLSTDFLLLPPDDFEGTTGVPMLFQYDGLVLPHPPPVFSDTEEAGMERDADETVSMETPLLLSSFSDRNCRDARDKVRKESNGEIVGGLLSVRQVCVLFENDQTQVIRDALDNDPASCFPSHPPSSAISVDKRSVRGFSERQPPVGVTMTTFKGPEIKGARNSVRRDSDKEFARFSSFPLHDWFRQNSSSNGRNVLDVNGSEFQVKIASDSCVSPVETPLNPPDSDQKSCLLNRSVGCSVKALTETDPKVTLTADAQAQRSIPATTLEDMEPEGGAVGGRAGPPDAAAAAAAAAAAHLVSYRNLIPEIVNTVDYRQDAETLKLRECSDNLSATNYRDKKVSQESLTGTAQGNGATAGSRDKSPSTERLRLKVLHITRSTEQKESERHFVSRTVRKTTTQETKTTGVTMATDSAAAAGSKVSGMFANERMTTFEKFGESNFLKEFGNRGNRVNEENDCHRETSKNLGCRSIFDSFLDNKEFGSEGKFFSTFGQREVTCFETERKSRDGKARSRDVGVESISSAENSEELKNSESSSNDDSTIPVNRMTDRTEEILLLPLTTTNNRIVLLRQPPQSPSSDENSSAVAKGDAGVAKGNASVAKGDASVVARQRNAPLATPDEDDAPPPSPPSSQPSTSRHSPSSLLRFQPLPPQSQPPAPPSGISCSHFVVVAIDFGTTYSGYAFSFTRDPDSIHMMRRWEGGDPGIVNQKTPTTLLLTPDAKFHSFGFTARDFYHDLDAEEAKKWLYFEKFKMTLHHNAELNKDTMIKAANGRSHSALTVFAHALSFFKDHSTQELSDQSSTPIVTGDIRWVLTVPAIWKAPAKQFMRQAAYQAGIASPENPDQLLIALEPEAASIYVRKLRLYQLMPDPVMTQLLMQLNRETMLDPLARGRTTDDVSSVDEYASPSSIKYRTLPSSLSFRSSVCPTSTTASVGEEVDVEGTNYMVVDCGGGTVDITVYEMVSGCGQLKELHRATGGPFGSIGIDLEFERLLVRIFGSDFIDTFRAKRPTGWVDLMVAFESRKRTANPFKNNPLNVSLPFSFVDYFKKCKGSHVENAIRKHGNKEVTWSSQGMLRLTMAAMKRLFQPTLDHIKQAVGDVLNHPNARDMKYMFLVGGFAESAILQMEMRKEFDHILKILIPQDVGLTILKGAVCFGLDPSVVILRRCRMTYGVGVLNRFIPGRHPRSKMITKDGAEWCTEVFDKFVEVDQSVAVGETVVRSYTPAKAGQKSTVIHVYCTEKPDPQYITDPGVKRCGTLCLDLTDLQYRRSQNPRRREIQAQMTFGDTEVKVTALDVATGKCVRAAIDFMNR